MINTKRSKLQFFLVSICLLMVLNFCKKKEDDLPFAYINQTYSLYDPVFFSLQSIGGSATIENEGINGILLYRKSLEEIVAYDGNCTYNPEARCAAKITNFSNEATDTCCGSVFQLFDGVPSKGPASLALYEYKVTFSGDNFTIRNF